MPVRGRRRFYAGRIAFTGRSLPVALRVAFFSWRGRDGAVHAVRFVVRSGGEEQRLLRLIVETVAEGHSPQSVELQCTMIRAAELALKLAGRRVVCIDRAVAEITDQDVV